MGDAAEVRRAAEFLEEVETKLAVQLWPLMNPTLSPEAVLALRKEKPKNPQDTQSALPLNAPRKTKRSHRCHFRKQRGAAAKRAFRNKRREYLRARRIRRIARVVSAMRKRISNRKRSRSGPLPTS